MIVSILILTAFICGFIVSRIGLPPLVGYLAAGFVLYGFGIESTSELQQLADLGILLLLFTIGLKLKIKTLIRPEIWASGSLHMAIITALFAFICFGLAGMNVSAFADFTLPQALIIGFGLSFSSTVFAIKTFEDRGDMASLHASIAIGVLIIQDIAAVLFLTFSSGKYPSVYAFVLIPALFILRPILLYLLKRCGHRELLLLFGLFVSIGLGAGSFELVNLKPDLGALFLGVLLANSPKADELSGVLLSIKDLLLVGFFLNIGLSGLPTVSSFLIATFFVLLLPFKSGLFYLLFARLHLRARTGFFSAVSLSHFSEFGLLVGATGVQMGLIGTEWLITMALAVSLSFLVSAPFNGRVHMSYGKLQDYLKKYETKKRLDYDRPIDTSDANVLIFGMGRIGTRAYDTFYGKKGFRVIGVDYKENAVEYHRENNRIVINGDATDLDLWEKICTRNVQLAMLTLESHRANMFAVEQLKAAGFQGDISAIAKFEDDREELLQAGVSCAYDLYKEAGQGYADELLALYKDVEES
jgi:glutathione-regulated potassium-efflux system ancillary protein KefC